MHHACYARAHLQDGRLGRAVEGDGRGGAKLVRGRGLRLGQDVEVQVRLEEVGEASLAFGKLFEFEVEWSALSVTRGGFLQVQE